MIMIRKKSFFSVTELTIADYSFCVGKHSHSNAAEINSLVSSFDFFFFTDLFSIIFIIKSYKLIRLDTRETCINVVIKLN